MLMLKTVSFVDRIRNVNLTDKIMVSFDVESLFTKVPVNECIEFLRNNIDNLNLELPIPNDMFVSLIELCVTEGYFSCNEKFYSQISGLPMGSPLSPVLANIFLEYFEGIVTQHNRL